MNKLTDLSARPVIGHRGNAAHAPENTLVSFQQAVHAGADALEMDVQLTGDGEVVVIHDPTLDRTTDRSGRIDRLSLADIRAADAGARFTPDRGATWPYRDQDITVPTLAEVLTAFPQLPCLIEVKTAAASRATRAVIEQAGAAARCVVASFDWQALQAFTGSAIATSASRRDISGLLLRAVFRQSPRRVPFDALCMPPDQRGIPLPVEGYARILAPLGVPVHIWTVDDPAEARALWARGVRGIITNDPATMVRARA